MVGHLIGRVTIKLAPLDRRIYGGLDRSSPRDLYLETFAYPTRAPSASHGSINNHRQVR